MADPWDDLDALIVEHDNSKRGGVPGNDALLVRATRAEKEVESLKERIARLVEAIKEERAMQEQAYLELEGEYKKSNERAVNLEAKMLKLIEAVRIERAKKSDGSGPSSGSSDSVRTTLASIKDNSAELLAEAEKKVGEANTRAQQAEQKLAVSQERLKLLEVKVVKAAEAIRVEREQTQKILQSDSEKQKQVAALQQALEAAKRTEEELRGEIKMLNQRVTSSPNPQQVREAVAQAQQQQLVAERKLKATEEKAVKLVSAFKQERARLEGEIAAGQDKIASLVHTVEAHQQKLNEMQQVIQQYKENESKNTSSNGSRSSAGGAYDAAYVQSLEQRAKEAEENARHLEEETEKKLALYTEKIKFYLAQQEARLTNMKREVTGGSGASSASNNALVSELEAKLQLAEQRAQLAEERARQAEGLAGLAPPRSSDVATAPAGLETPNFASPTTLRAQLTTSPSTARRSAHPQKPASASGTENLAAMARDLADQRQQRITAADSPTHLGYRRSVRLDVMLDDIAS